MTDDVSMTEPELGFPVYDADNHFYEQNDAFTRHLPVEYRGLIQYVEVRGRTKIAIKNVVSDYIPNPTFEVVARPGAQQDYFKHGNPEGKSRREILGEPMRAIDAFFSPEPRLTLLNELGIDRTLMWPTLASLLEERLSDDPRATHAVVHAFNQWMHEEWTFDYRDRIFPTPIITLPIVDRAIEELEWVLERGARIVLIRPAPVPGYEGTRSFALPEFDPFWAKVAEADIAVGMHSSDDGTTKYLNLWEGWNGEYRPWGKQGAFEEVFRHQHRGIMDAMMSAVCHGLFTRFPTLRVLPIETGSVWVAPLLQLLEHSYEMNPRLFDEDPVAVFKRNVWVHPFHEDDPMALVRLIGADRVLFGSDYPHPEGLERPRSYVDRLEGLPDADIARIMGGNLAGVMKFAA
jgi:predicted TIM-barrel fold metal-dependent hydrolase